jgi:hypothetical protein
MTQDEIIEMARQAGGIDITNTLAGNFTAWINTGTPEFLERFAALVASFERERVQKIYEDAAKDSVKAAIKQEREACATLCDVQALTVAASAEVCAEAIRARPRNRIQSPAKRKA